jgi:hypothetical protein
MNNTSGSLVSPSGRYDTIKKVNGKWCRFEIKTNGGKIAYTKKTSRKMYEVYKHCAYIIYMYGYESQGLEWILDNAVVIPADEFFPMLERGGNVKRNYRMENGEKVLDRMYIQHNSKTKQKALLENMAQYLPLGEFLEVHGIDYNMTV